MKPGRSSQTAVLVCMGRAMAHGKTAILAYSDPTAIALLPDLERRQVERFHAGLPPANRRERLARWLASKRTPMMVTRTVAIDDAIRRAASPQVVILGAGLDGRVWRMSELRQAVVFEVDHPDSQRDKRSRAALLSALAQDIRFVPLDFSHGDLAKALRDAGHDSTLPTTWVWEGVVMYLTVAQVEAALTVIARLSAPQSRLVVAYFQPGFGVRLIGLAVRLVGEPLRSTFTAWQMRDLLAKYHFNVLQDEDLRTIADRLYPTHEAPGRGLKHLRVVTSMID